MTPTEKKLILDRLDKFEEEQKKHEGQIAHTLTLAQATAQVVEDMEERMSAFEPVLAGIDTGVKALLKEKENKEIIAAAIKATPSAQFMSKLKAQLMNTVVLLISGAVVATVIGIVVLLFKNGAFKALGWG